jgi:hypothetical protein
VKSRSISRRHRSAYSRVRVRCVSLDQIRWRRKRARPSHLHPRSPPSPDSSEALPVADAAAAAQAPSPRPDRPTAVTWAQQQAQAVILTAHEGAAEQRRRRPRVQLQYCIQAHAVVFSSAVRRCPVRRRRRLQIGTTVHGTSGSVMFGTGWVVVASCC